MYRSLLIFRNVCPRPEPDSRLFSCFFSGMFLMNQNVVVACVLVLFALAIHRQVLREL